MDLQEQVRPLNLNHKISRFSSMQELQESIGKKIKDVDREIELQSKLIGDKIRESEKNNDEEISDLKEKLNPETTHNKKIGDKRSKNKKASKSKRTKKNQLQNWIDYEGLHLYNGIGTSGEIELCFKSLEDLKAESERLKNTQTSLGQLMKSGIKKELSGIGYDQIDGPFELAFIKSNFKREKFSFKSILTVGCE